MAAHGIGGQDPIPTPAATTDQAANCAPDLARVIAGAIDWWRDAGVDLCFDEEPAQWISAAQPTALAAERMRAELRQAAPDPMSGAAARDTRTRRLPLTAAESRLAIPDTIAAFTQWWLADPMLDEGRTSGRVAPRGPIGAELMVMVAEPEADDRDHLLGGPQGKLLDAVLSALGVAPDAVYVASALPRHTPLPDWSGLAAQGLGDAAARHIALAAPARLICFGSGDLSLLGHRLTKNAAETTQFTHEGTTLPVLAARSLDGMLARPAWKAEFWAALLDLTQNPMGQGSTLRA